MHVKVFDAGTERPVESNLNILFILFVDHFKALFLGFQQFDGYLLHMLN